MRFLNKLRRDEKGATAIEYGLIAALVAVAAIAGMQSLGGSVQKTFADTSKVLADPKATPPA